MPLAWHSWKVEINQVVLRRGQIAEWRREREKEVRREKLDLPGREICPNKSGARAGDSVRDEPG